MYLLISISDFIVLENMNPIIIKEEDENNPTKLFIIARLCKAESNLKFNSNIYKKQYDLFVKEMKNENYLVIYLKKDNQLLFHLVNKIEKTNDRLINLFLTLKIMNK